MKHFRRLIFWISLNEFFYSFFLFIFFYFFVKMMMTRRWKIYFSRTVPVSNGGKKEAKCIFYFNKNQISKAKENKKIEEKKSGVLKYFLNTWVINILKKMASINLFVVLFHIFYVPSTKRKVFFSFVFRQVETHRHKMYLSCTYTAHNFN